MNKKMLRIVAIASVLCPAASFAQAPRAATYITAAEIKKVNAEPGIDHTLHVVDIGNEHLAVGIIAGADIVNGQVKTGDVVIIPAGVPHGWIDITDHVDYLSIRPSDHVLEAGYVHPSLRK